MYSSDDVIDIRLCDTSIRYIDIMYACLPEDLTKIKTIVIGFFLVYSAILN